MAYLTQYSSSVPIIKFHIDQILMTIGQDFEMDICVPEDGIAGSHATVEAVKKDGLYHFVVKTQENEPLIDLNGENVSLAKLSDGDWLNIGGVEFKFTDDGIYSFEEKLSPKNETLKNKATPQAFKTSTESPALKLIKELKEELKEDLKPLTTKEFIANSRQSRRRLAF